ncbi:hypothetical protein [Streptomyces sp. NPDC057557]|uniref:hypothetical protein n=1 Tax=Streptomyces sp. NPDC057557 TaxID=3346167 RepID=UPI0036A34D5C
MQLPEPYQQQAQAGQSIPGQPTDPVKEQARQVAAAVDAVYAEKATFHRDKTPLPIIGSAAPVPQPGRPPMSQGATDASVLMLAGGASTAMVGGTAATIMYFSQYADLTVCAVVLGAPAVLVLAIGRLVGRVKATVEAAPPTHHHHYNGDVVQDSRSITTTTRGVIANTRNQTR